MSERRKVLELFEAQKQFMEGKIQTGIESHRKGFGNLTVTDQNGNPVSGAKITVNQKSHEFKFGANLFMLEEFETPEKNEKYKEYFSDFFNMATLPFYWNATEPEKGQTRYDKNSPKLYRRPPIDLCMEFCEKHGIEPREHALAYEQFFPEWLSQCSVFEVKKAFEKRCMEISERYRDRIPTIEVTNEMEWPKGKTAFYNEPDFIEWCFKTAEKYFPSNQLVINDHTALVWGDNIRPSAKYYAYTEAAMLKGARVDAIGLQYHMFYRKESEYKATRPYYNPQNLYAHMDLYSALSKPLQVTEVTIPAYSGGAEDEQIQAEILETLYSIWFSHPAMEQIVYWNLVDGYAHVADATPEKIRATQGNMAIGENYFHGGLIRFDMSPKPAYYTLKNLIQNKWHTAEKLVSSADGTAAFKGFYGKYDVTVEAEGKTVTCEINLYSKSPQNNNFMIKL